MKAILIVLVLFAASFGTVSAQDRQMHHGSNKAHEKINELEKIKLMEALNLDEATMVKFFARRKEFQDKIQDLNRQKNDELDQLQNALNSGDNSGKDEQFFRKDVDDIKAIELNIAKTKNDYFSSLKDILDQKQIAKLMVFERNFRRELREIIFKERKKNND